MRSTGQQQLFKSMSNRTRTRPDEMYVKFNAQLAELQDQVTQFNKEQQKIAKKCHPLSVRSGSSHSVKLKSMSQPKYQELLLNCQLPTNEKSSPKRLKMSKKFSAKSGKSFNSFGLGSSMTSFIGFKSNTQSKLAQSKLMSYAASKGNKSKGGMQSTMLNTGRPENVSSPMDNNLSVTQSIVFNNIPQIAQVKRKIKVKDLKQLVLEKHMKLQTEWCKTESYHMKVSNYLGEGELVRLQKYPKGQTRIGNVIDKIQRSRIATANGTRDVRCQRVFSEN